MPTRFQNSAFSKALGPLAVVSLMLALAQPATANLGFVWADGPQGWTSVALSGSGPGFVIEPNCADYPPCFQIVDPEPGTDYALTSPVLIATGPAALSFVHRRERIRLTDDGEQAIDGGVVEIKIEDGDWVDVGNTWEGVSYEFTVASGVDNPLEGREVFAVDNFDVARNSTTELAVPTGQRFQVRLRLAVTSPSGDGTFWSFSSSIPDYFAEPSGIWFTNADIPPRSLARLYSAAFDRLPKVPGLNFWVDSFDAGRSLQSIAADFAVSDEFLDKYGALSNRAFVEQLFRNVLGREGAQGGINFWTGLLDNGTPRGDILASFADSPENREKTRETYTNMRQNEDGDWVFMDEDIELF